MVRKPCYWGFEVTKVTKKDYQGGYILDSYLYIIINIPLLKLVQIIVLVIELLNHNIVRLGNWNQLGQVYIRNFVPEIY